MEFSINALAKTPKNKTGWPSTVYEPIDIEILSESELVFIYDKKRSKQILKLTFDEIRLIYGYIDLKNQKPSHSF